MLFAKRLLQKIILQPFTGSGLFQIIENNLLCVIFKQGKLAANFADLPILKYFFTR